jgi:2-C-methyl-D-erythritol 2,4-cyclodiphosphate synthase
MRIGTGYDVHKLAPERKLVIGGVEIPFEKGLLGHSDADVLVHAIIDALLGASALGDIGKFFPDSEPAYKDISSLKMLESIGWLLEGKLFFVENIDATIIAEAPKMQPYIDEMRQNIAITLRLYPEQVSIKATSEEGLGFTGSGEGIAAQAVCLLTSPVNLQGEYGGCDPGGCAACGGCGSF